MEDELTIQDVLVISFDLGKTGDMVGQNAAAGIVGQRSAISCRSCMVDRSIESHLGPVRQITITEAFLVNS